MRAAIVLGALAACSFPTKTFSNGSVDASADAPSVTPDGPPGAPDAPGDAAPSSHRAATLSIADATVVDSDAKSLGLRGGIIQVAFADTSQGGGTIVYGTTVVQGCVVTKFTLPSNAPSPNVDAGTVTISGNALLMPVGPCNYTSAAAPYDCVSDEASSSVQAVSAGGNIVHFFVTGHDFLAADVGAYLDVHGFANAAFDGRFPIIEVQDDGTGHLDEVSAVVPTSTTGGTTETKSMTWKVVNGAGPFPAAIVGQSGAFLTSMAGAQQANVEVSKPADSDWPAFDLTVPSGGDGFTLSAATDQPTAFPSTARDVTFSCTGSGCGTAVTPPTGELRGTVVFGTTTDAAVTGLPTYVMPAPTNTFTSFVCVGLLSDSVTVPSAAVQAILATSPTRIETTVFRAAGAQLPDSLGDPTGSLLVGHGVVGHTTL